MKLSEYKFPEVNGVDQAFPTFNTTKELVEHAEALKLTKGRAKFNELFFSGGKLN